MADGAVAGQAVECCCIGEMVTDKAHMALGMEAAIVIGNNTGGFLSAMLEGVQAQCRQRGSVFMAKNAKYTTLFMQGVVIQHKGSFIMRMLEHCPQGLSDCGLLKATFT